MLKEHWTEGQEPGGGEVKCMLPKQPEFSSPVPKANRPVGVMARQRLLDLSQFQASLLYTATAAVQSFV